MNVRTRSETLGSKTLWMMVTLTVLLPARLALALPVCSSNCMIGACTLSYNAAGVVRDNITGAPIAGAQITLLDASGVSAADGSYSVRGSHPDQCHYDYFFSMSVAAPGYELFSDSGYWTGINLSGYEIRLNPIGTSVGHTVSGFVAEFPFCMGRMRGVTVVLEPIGLTTQTTIGPDGGEFTFTNVTRGEYTIRIAQGCNPYGCWLPERADVQENDVSIEVCLSALTPSPTPTPTPGSHVGPSATFTVCPEKTPCVLGEQPLPCGERCGLGCGCAACPTCPEGTLSAPRFNSCECIPDPNVTPPPTSTPGNCFFPTPPLCPVGETAQCVTEDGCDSDCGCVACDPCPPGLSYSGEPNSCVCLDPRTVTATPTPDTRTSTPTPDFCPHATPPLCPPGEAPSCIATDCIVGCSCEPCNDCLEGFVRSDEVNSCDCVDPRAPSEQPTATPSPRSGETPPACPSTTPMVCPTGWAAVCDTSVDPCGICECRAVPQQPAGEDNTLSPDSSGGCGIVAPRDARGTLWSWSLLLATALAWRRSRRRRG